MQIFLLGIMIQRYLPKCKANSKFEANAQIEANSYILASILSKTLHFGKSPNCYIFLKLSMDGYNNIYQNRHLSILVLKPHRLQSIGV